MAKEKTHYDPQKNGWNRDWETDNIPDHFTECIDCEPDPLTLEAIGESTLMPFESPPAPAPLPEREPKRICVQCGSAILSHHKYTKDGDSYRHRDCSHPEEYREQCGRYLGGSGNMTFFCKLAKGHDGYPEKCADGRLITPVSERERRLELRRTQSQSLHVCNDPGASQGDKFKALENALDATIELRDMRESEREREEARPVTDEERKEGEKWAQWLCSRTSVHDDELGSEHPWKLVDVDLLGLQIALKVAKIVAVDAGQVREECAKIAESEAKYHEGAKDTWNKACFKAFHHIAAAIRKGR